MPKIYGLETLIEQMRLERAELQRVADEQREKTNLVEGQLARLDAAFAALNGDVLQPLNGKASKQKKLSLPSASKAQVITLMTTELSKANKLREEELKERLERQLVQSGHTRLGFSLRFKEALADAKFFKDESGISLIAFSTTATSSGTSHDDPHTRICTGQTTDLSHARSK